MCIRIWLYRLRITFRSLSDVSYSDECRTKKAFQYVKKCCRFFVLYQMSLFLKDCGILKNFVQNFKHFSTTFGKMPKAIHRLFIQEKRKNNGQSAGSNIISSSMVFLQPFSHCLLIIILYTQSYLIKMIRI